MINRLWRQRILGPRNEDNISSADGKINDLEEVFRDSEYGIFPIQQMVDNGCTKLT